MLAAVYLLPVLACLLLHFGFNFRGEWTAYLWVIIFGEATIGALHYYAYRHLTSAKEYMGAIVTRITYEEPWTELIERTERRTDSRGNSYNVTRIEEKYHPEKYHFLTSLGSTFACPSGFFDMVRNVWAIPGYGVSWSGRNIRGGTRYGREYSFYDLPEDARTCSGSWVPVTELHTYRNKIRRSNSIFKFERISKEEARQLGLYDYPKIRHFDAPCILSSHYAVPPEADFIFRQFNARIAPKAQMRLYILIFDASAGICISEKQRAYWQGGHKNEFTICIGLTAKGEIGWARAFSWADTQTLEVETASWIEAQKKIDWHELFRFLAINIDRWKRKEFKDFDYITVDLPPLYAAGIVAASLLENTAAVAIALS